MSKFKDLVCIWERQKEKKTKEKNYKTWEGILEEEKEKGRNERKGKEEIKL